MQSSVTQAWLLFVASVPGQRGTPRMRLWRALKGLGAAVLRDGVYLLPAQDGLREALQEQAQAVRREGGAAYVLEVAPGADAADFASLFDRREDYAALLAAQRELLAGLAAWTETEARRRLRQWRRDFEAVARIDYFPGPIRAQAEQALTEAEAAVNRRYCPDEPQPAPRAIEHLEPAAFQGRTWATRARLWVDRVACAWLIRRFIDPGARFVWLERIDDCREDMLGFDFDGARFTHVDGRVTFEVLLASFGLNGDPALARLGALVHYLDVGGVPQPEAAGLEAVLSGVRGHCPDDDCLLEAMTPVLNALHTAFAHAADPARNPA